MSSIGQAWQNAKTLDIQTNGESVWVINRAFSGPVTAANYNEQTLSESSGTTMARVTNPTDKDVLLDGGHYLQEDRIFRLTSGTVVQQYDYIKLDNTGETFLVTEICPFIIGGTLIDHKVSGRRIKT